MKRMVAVFFVTIALALNPLSSASGADSVSVPGQVSVDQCPVGYQHSTGISVNVTTHEYSTICNAAPNAADILLQQQDQDFRLRQDAAAAAAQAESVAWNNANPGQQKCVQWGPIVHANGVSTASGGVCANPVTIPNGGATPIENTDPISGDVTLRNPVTLQPINQPFSVQVPGQVGVEGCPVGYQAANGLQVNASTGVVTTECWSESAWKANRLGGDTWSQFVATGGAVDVDLEIERRAAVAALKAQAHSVAQAAADTTPGVKRCTHWSGYGESGEECAYAFVNPDSATPAPVTNTDVPRDAQVVSAGEQVLASLSTMTSALRTSNLTDSAKTAATGLFSKLQKITWPKGSKAITLPATKVGTVIYKSGSSKVCSVKGRVVTRKSLGSCDIQTVLMVNPWTKVSTVKRLALKK